MASLQRWIAGCVAVFGIAACGQSAGSDAPPIDVVACEDAGFKCGSGANTSSSGKDAGADADAASDAEAAPPLETTTVAISVGVPDSRFAAETAIPFKSAGFLSVPTLTGQKDYAIDADAGSGLVIDGVVVGEGWFQVRPTNNADLYTTHSFLTVHKADPVLFVPVIDRVQLGAIYTATPLAAPLQQTAGQIVVIFVNELGARVAGVRVTDSPFAFDGLLYDNGPDSFQTDSGSLQTGKGGMVIFTNVTSGIGAFSYDYQGAIRSSHAITWVIGQATVVQLLVPKP